MSCLDKKDRVENIKTKIKIAIKKLAITIKETEKIIDTKIFSLGIPLMVIGFDSSFKLIASILKEQPTKR
jgi:hypothetical protein